LYTDETFELRALNFLCVKHTIFMQHKMKLSSEAFGKIARKEKVVESRLYDEKRQTIQLGDEIEFSENDKPENVVRVRVIGLLRYQVFQDLFRDHEPTLFGGERRDFLLQNIKSFYSDENEQKYGVVGVRIEVIDR
jgi:ASC-1-like (ASCH) protein